MISIMKYQNKQKFIKVFIWISSSDKSIEIQLRFKEKKSFTIKIKYFVL